ncbi:MAG TPA: hypothetical protein VGB66_02400, partial [Longimicrobium sp.]
MMRDTLVLTMRWGWMLPGQYTRARAWKEVEERGESTTATQSAFSHRFRDVPRGTQARVSRENRFYRV